MLQHVAPSYQLKRFVVRVMTSGHGSVRDYCSGLMTIIKPERIFINALKHCSLRHVTNALDFG